MMPNVGSAANAPEPPKSALRSRVSPFRVPDFSLLGEWDGGRRPAVLAASGAGVSSSSRLDPASEATDALLPAVDVLGDGNDAVSQWVRGLARAFQRHLACAADDYDTGKVMVAKPTGPIKPHQETADRALHLSVLEPLVRRACLGLVDRVLADTRLDQSSQVCHVSLNGVPWLGHSALKAPRIVKRVARVSATLHVSAIAFSVPDLCSPNSSRKVCLLRAGENAPTGQDAVDMNRTFRAKYQCMQVCAGRRFSNEVAEVRAALDSLSNGDGADDDVQSIPFAVIFDSLPEPQQVSLRAIVAEFPAESATGLLPSACPVRAARPHLVRMVLRRDFDPARPLLSYLPEATAISANAWWKNVDDTSEFVRGYKRTIERIAYCALCRLPACIVITGEYSALAESVVAVVTAIYGLDDSEDALHSNHEWPPTLGDFEECAVIKWTPPQSVAAATIALPTNVVRVTVDNSGVALSLAQGWIPADLVVNTSDLVGSGNSSAMTSPVPLSAHTKTSGVGGSVLPPQAAAAASIPPSSQSATSMRTIGGASAHLTDAVNPDDIVWELPKNSIIRATLHRAKDRAGIRSAMSVMTRYLATRARHAGMFASGDLMPAVCSVNLAPPELGKGPALWSPIFLLTQNTGSGSYGISNALEPAWLVNCLRGQAAEMCAGRRHQDSITLVQPFTYKAGSTLCSRDSGVTTQR